MEEFVLEELYDFVKLSIISIKIVSLFVLLLALNFCLHRYQRYGMNYIMKLIQIQSKKTKYRLSAGFQETPITISGS